MKATSLAIIRRLRAVPWFIVALVAAALVWFIAFLTVGDLDNALLAIACVALACYEADHRQIAAKLRVFADANEAAGLELSRTAGQIHALLAEKRQLNGRLAGYIARFGPIAAHNAKFADMPRIGTKPLPVPEGHPEYQAGNR